MSVTRLVGGNTPADGADPRTFPAIWNETADDLEAGDYSKVPTGGAAGEVLAKVSGTDYDAAWVFSKVDVLTPTSGQFHADSRMPSAGTTTPTLDELRAVPLYIPQTLTFDQIAIRVTTAATAGGVIRLGIYENNVNAPGELIVDAGTVDSTATGSLTVTISQTLPQGYVWLAAVSQVATASINRYDASGAGTLRLPSDNAGATFTQKLAGVAQSSVTGTLPSTFAATGSFTVGGAPFIILRVA
jgi:hypothetical protein